MAIPRWDVDQSVEVVHALGAEVNDDSETLSTAIDLSLNDRGRCKILVVFRATASPTGAFAHGVTFAVTESATSGGTYAASSTSGDLTKLTAVGTEYVGVKLNPSKQFLKLSATGDHTDALMFVTATVIFIKPTV